MTATPTPSIRMMTSWAEADRSRRRSPSCLFVSITSDYSGRILIIVGGGSVDNKHEDGQDVGTYPPN